MNAASMRWVVVMRVAWKAARKVRRATAAARLWERLRALGVRPAGVESGLRRMKLESMKPHAWEGPMPHSVVTTRGRKALPRAWQPAACLAVLSSARLWKMASESEVAAWK